MQKQGVTKLSAHDVAAYVVKKLGRMSAFKMHKLLYYCQAWSLVWDERPLFEERIEAWANGPVVPAIYEFHKGKFEIAKWEQGDRSKVDSAAQETIDSVLDHYGNWHAQQLVDKTHNEAPWINARIGLKEGERGDREITLDSLAEYFSSL